MSSEDGLKELDTLVQAFPDDARLHFLHGSLNADLKNYEKAVEDFGRSVEMDPDFHIARFQYGLLLFCLDRQQAALEAWASLEALDDDDCLLLFKRG